MACAITGRASKPHSGEGQTHLVHGSDSITILFEQGSFFKTEEEAEHTTALVPKIRFPRRNTYVITLNQIKLLRREISIGGIWQVQSIPMSECWHLYPILSLQSTERHLGWQRLGCGLMSGCLGVSSYPRVSAGCA
jgi:hypothetical protein